MWKPTHAEEVDGGPARGRFVQVKISGYTSAAEVQRALIQIRELPGGYRDARVIESDGTPALSAPCAFAFSGRAYCMGRSTSRRIFDKVIAPRVVDT